MIENYSRNIEDAESYMKESLR